MSRSSPHRNPQCGCTSCDRSCYRGKSGTTHRVTGRETTMRRLKALREWINGEGEKPA